MREFRTQNTRKTQKNRETYKNGIVGALSIAQKASEMGYISEAFYHTL